MIANHYLPLTLVRPGHCQPLTPITLFRPGDFQPLTPINPRATVQGTMYSKDVGLQ